MEKQIKIRYYNREAFEKVKKATWLVCEQLYEMKEEDYYQRLSIFKRFAIFWKGDIAIGFVSFLEHHIKIQGEKILLFGIGHGGLLKEYRSKGLIIKACMPQMLRLQLKYPFKKTYMWGMLMSHLSYRLAVRNVKHYFIRSNTKEGALEREVIDYIGNNFYPQTYVQSRGIAAVSFHVKDPLALPDKKELEHPLTQMFFKELPEAKSSNNQKGLLYIYSPRKNYLFWIRKNILKSVK